MPRFSRLDAVGQSSGGSCSFEMTEPLSLILLGLPWWLRGYSVCLQCGRPGFNPWVEKIPWRRKWHPIPVLLPGKSHGWRSLVSYSSQGCTESDMTECVSSTQSRHDSHMEPPPWCHSILRPGSLTPPDTCGHFPEFPKGNPLNIQEYDHSPITIQDRKSVV